MDLTSLLGDDGPGPCAPTPVDGRDVGAEPQEFQIGIGEDSSKTNIPSMCNLGLRAELVGDGGDIARTVTIVLEGHNVTPENSVLGLPNRDVERASSESWENAESDSQLFCGGQCRLMLVQIASPRPFICWVFCYGPNGENGVAWRQ